MGDKNAVVNSYKQYISNFMESYKTDNRENIFFVDGLGWRKKIFEPKTDFEIDVRATDSLISPYIGTCDFTLITHLTAFHKTKAEAEQDRVFVTENTMKHRHTYALQDDIWVPKSRQHYYAALNDWFDCNKDGEEDGCDEREGRS